MKRLVSILILTLVTVILSGCLDRETSKPIIQQVYPEAKFLAEGHDYQTNFVIKQGDIVMCVYPVDGSTIENPKVIINKKVDLSTVSEQSQGAIISKVIEDCIR